MNDVETILSEIRERVRAEEQQRVELIAPANNHHRNGSGGAVTDLSSEATEPLRAHLATTARAWERLPPVCSNRRGVVARLELWLKGRFKTLSHWFTWEQVNFNAAVHHALSEASGLLSAQQRELASLRAAIDQQRAAIDQQRVAIDQQNAQHAQHAARMRAEIEAEHHKAIEGIGVRLGRIESRIDELRTEYAALIKDMGDERLVRFAEIDSRLVELAADLREEQRVCFKQLSLEVSEAAVMEDRGRRSIEARLEQLEKSPPPR
jgi:hypothetical protein